MQESVDRSARIVGLPVHEAPSLDSVERRRLQLSGLTLGLLLALAGGFLLLSMWVELPGVGGWTSPEALRIGLFILVAAFCVYILEKEWRLRRLTAQLVEERVRTSAFSTRLRDVSALATAARTVNQTLSVGSVLQTLLAETLRLFEAPEGSVMLLGDDGHLHVACRTGSGAALGARLRVGSGIPGQVALTRLPLLISGDTDPRRFWGAADGGRPPSSAMSVPLIHRDRILGVLNVTGGPEKTFNDQNLEMLTAFGGYAAVAIANGRLYETERARAAELEELGRLKAELVTTVSHELRTPLTSIVAGLSTLQRVDLDAERRDELVRAMGRQAHRLTKLVEKLLAEAELEERTDVELREVDLSVVARAVEHDLAVGGVRVEVAVGGPCRVLGDPDLLGQAVANLVDNAFVHGRPPVRISVTSDERRGVISVTDAGPGVPPEMRERIFGEFARGHRDPSRPGVGIGLAIVRRVAEACKGRAWVAEAPSGGAAFHLALTRPGGTNPKT